MRQRVVDACDTFVDVRDKSDRDVARLSREYGIDIAVDLKGYTHDARPGIFAERCAPIQVSYLGFPGTMGADYMDYLVADRVVLPPQSQGDYSEKNHLAAAQLPGQRFQAENLSQSLHA